MLEARPYPEHVSYSQMKEYADCPYYFVLKRKYRAPEAPSIWLLGGSAFHVVVESEELARLGMGEIVTWADAWAEQVEKAATKWPGVPLEDYRRGGRVSKAWPNKEDVRFWNRLGPEMVTKYRRWRDLTPTWQVATLNGVPAIEFDITVDLDGTPLVGAADLLMEDVRDQTLIAVDLKTGATEKETPDQLGTYATAVRLLTGREVKWGTFYRARKGEHDGLRYMGPYFPARLKHEYEQFQTLRDSGFAMPRRGEHCGWCSLRDYCVYANGPKASEVPVPWPVYNPSNTNNEEK
jgi:putative RecB family exonuclease